MTIRTRSLSLGLALVALAGCKAETLTGPAADLVGTYQMTRLNQQTLPFTLTGLNCETTVTKATVDLRGSGKVEGSMSYRYDCKPGGVSAPQTGAWDIKGTWHIEGTELLLVKDDQVDRAFGPVLENGTANGTITITLAGTLRDCQGGANACKITEIVLTLTR